MNVYATKDWYYVQAFRGSTYGVGYTVCFAKSMQEAKTKAKKWAVSKGLNGDIHLYRNNYKRDAANLVSRGIYI